MKLKCLELIGISITRDALYKRVERQSKKKPTEPTSPVEELILYVLYTTKANNTAVVWCVRTVRVLADFL